MEVLPLFKFALLVVFRASVVIMVGICMLNDLCYSLTVMLHVDRNILWFRCSSTRKRVNRFAGRRNNSVRANLFYLRAGKPVKMVWGELASGRNLQIQQKMEGKNVLNTPDFSPRKERDGDAVVPFFFSQQLFVKPKSLTSTSFVLSPAPPCHGMTPLTRPSTRRDYFCGGSRRHICPADSYCHISPSDAFAKCCSGRTCLISFNPKTPRDD